MTHHVMKAGLDDKNELVSWHHRIVSENVDAVAAPPRFAATGGRDYIGWVGMSQEFYKIPNLKADAYAVVGNTQLVAAAHSAPSTPFTANATTIDHIR